MSDAKAFMRRQIAGRVHRGTTALNLIMEASPVLLGFSMFVGHVDDHRESEWPGSIESDVWNDGKQIHYAPQFETRDIREQASLVAKHLFKIALCHAGRARRMKSLMGSAFEDRLFVLASDLVVHQVICTGASHNRLFVQLKPILRELIENHLAWCKEVHLPEPRLAPPHEWSVEQVYSFLQRWRDAILDSDLGDAASMDRREDAFRVLLDKALVDIDWNGEDSLDGENSESIRSKDNEAMRNWRNRFERAKAGDRPGGMLRVISGDLPAVKTPWNTLIRADTLRAIGKRPTDDWSKASRRMISLMCASPLKGRPIPFDPARMQRAPAPKIAILIDTSGSIGHELLDLFAANLAAIQRAKRTMIRIIVGDAAVTEVEDVRPDQLRDICKTVKFKGGGGTDFRPLIAEATRWNPDVIIYLTDLAGTFPEKAPKCPFIWAAIPMPGMNTDHTVPFGNVVVLE